MIELNIPDDPNTALVISQGNSFISLYASAIKILMSEPEKGSMEFKHKQRIIDRKNKL